MSEPPRSLIEAAAFHELDHRADHFARGRLQPERVPWAARHEAFEAARAGQASQLSRRMAGFLFRLDERKVTPTGAAIDVKLSFFVELLSQIMQSHCTFDEALRAAWEVSAQVPALKLFPSRDAASTKPPAFSDLVHWLEEPQAVQQQLISSADSAWLNAIKDWRRQRPMESRVPSA